MRDWSGPPSLKAVVRSTSRSKHVAGILGTGKQVATKYQNIDVTG